MTASSSFDCRERDTSITKNRHSARSTASRSRHHTMSKRKMFRSQALATSWATKTKRAKRRSRCAARKLMAETCPEKAAEVFGMPELMEHILTFVSPKDVLTALQTTRSMRNTVQGSSKLKTKAFGLMPDPDSFFAAPMWKPTLQSSWEPSPSQGTVDQLFGTFALATRSPQVSQEWCSQFQHLYFDLGPRHLIRAFVKIYSFLSDVTTTRLTPQQRQLIPIQPAVREIKYWDFCTVFSCRSASDRTGRARGGTIYPQTGSEIITFGDLEDDANRFAKAHHFCAPHSLADACIFFYADVTLKDDDPCMIRHQQTQATRQEIA